MASTIKCIPVRPKTDCAYLFGASFVNVSPVDLPNIPLAKAWKTKPAFMNVKYASIAEDIANFEVRPDDIWVVSFPKTGSTWTQEMMRLLNSNLDYEQAAKTNILDCYGYIEAVAVVDMKELDYETNLLKLIAERPSPRYIKTHLPIELLPRSIWTVKPKIVYVTRNPKDTAVSFFHQYRNLHGYHGDIEAFMKVFLAEETLYGPFYEHVLNYWYSRNEPNILFITYEQMKSDMMAVLRQAQLFLGKSFPEEQLERLSRHLDVDTMRHNPSANNSSMVEKVFVILGQRGADADFR